MEVNNASFLRRIDQPGPRYTSYPTADRFVEAFGVGDYGRALQQRRAGVAAVTPPLSIYVHLPFCESLCYYCACNKIITKNHGRAAKYLHYVAKETELHAHLLGEGQPVSQLHFGGGTPTFFNDAELKDLVDTFARSFTMSNGGERSIEVDPRTVDTARLEQLAHLGFNRISFGVQDFDANVQRAVHRLQPYEQVAALMAHARTLPFDSINVDLIYGLPRQTAESFKRTLAQVTGLRPDRIALYAYAHLPERFKSQRRIAISEMPAGGEKLNMLAEARQQFATAGYVHVGMDHFALPNDALAVARRQGRLHRNFQGYSTQPDCDLIGLGVSAIGHVGATFSQNSKILEDYYDAIGDGRFAVVRGLALSRDDLLRNTVIMAIMCQGGLQFESINLAHLIQFEDYFAQEMRMLQEFSDQGLLVLDGQGMELTESGWLWVRAVAMVFDRYTQADQNRARYSRII